MRLLRRTLHSLALEASGMFYQVPQLISLWCLARGGSGGGLRAGARSQFGRRSRQHHSRGPGNTTVIKPVVRIISPPYHRMTGRDLGAGQVGVRSKVVVHPSPRRDPPIALAGGNAPRFPAERHDFEIMTRFFWGASGARMMAAAVHFVCIDALEPDAGSVRAAHCVAIMHADHPTLEWVGSREKQGSEDHTSTIRDGCRCATSVLGWKAAGFFQPERPHSRRSIPKK